MFEYGAVLAGDFRETWAGEFLPLLHMIRDSPYFWPGVAVLALALFTFTRQFTK